MRALCLAVVVSAALLGAGCAGAPGRVYNMNPAVETKQYATYSWGLAGVSFETYEDATLECLVRAAKFTPDVSGVAAPEPMIDVASGQASVDSLVSQAWVVQNAQAREGRRQTQVVIDACLTELGFVKFGLTDRQLQTLDALARGTPERKRYLHSLGSDPAVLAAQRL